MRPMLRRHRAWTLVWLLLVASWLAPPPALAEEDDLDQGKIYAIQDRSYRMNHEFALSFGFMPLDAFYKMFDISFHYVVHFDELWAWEAAHLTVSKYMSIDTGLKDQLNQKWDVQPTDPEEDRIDFILDTNLMIKPLVGKAVLFDDYVIHGETYFLAGVGAEKFETAWYPAIDLGVGLRIYIIDTISFRLEVREYLNFGEGVGSNLIFTLGFAYNAFAEDVKPSRPVDEEGAQ